MRSAIKSVGTLPLLLAALLSLSVPASAQGPQPPPDQPDTTLKPNPIEALKAFEPPAGQPYTLGRGDEITVTAAGRPEVTGHHIIGPDGEITLPIAGPVKVSDLTRDQAAAAIAKKLAPFYSEISIEVGVDKYTSNQILLLGAVPHPGILTFDKTPTLLEVISRGGGQIDTTNPSGGVGSRPAGVPEECMIYRGNDTMITVELKALLDQGSPLANMRLKRDDIVYVTGRSRYISVLGEVTHPGNLQLGSTTTLSELLAEAGGPTEKAGRNPKIQIIHRAGSHGSARTQVVAFKSLLQNNALDLSLQTGDIVFVTESGFNGIAYTMDKLAPLVNIFTTASILTTNE